VFTGVHCGIDHCVCQSLLHSFAGNGISMYIEGAVSVRWQHFSLPSLLNIVLLVLVVFDRYPSVTTQSPSFGWFERGDDASVLCVPSYHPTCTVRHPTCTVHHPTFGCCDVSVDRRSCVSTQTLFLFVFFGERMVHQLASRSHV
jgi:hypothetical protein